MSLVLLTLVVAIIAGFCGGIVGSVLVAWYSVSLHRRGVNEVND